MNGCIATFYESESDDQKKKIPIETISFTTKAYLAFRNVDSLRIAPPAVPYLKNLTSLQLQNNNLRTLPNELWRLTSLEELNLGSNLLEEIPIEIGLLVNLRKLYLHNNYLTRLPGQLGNLKHLKFLDTIDNHDLDCLPAELLKLERVTLLSNAMDDTIQGKTAKKDLRVISLKSICVQTIGLLCSEDEESRQIVSEHLPEESILDKHILLSAGDINVQSLMPRCYECSSLLFHSDLALIRLNQKTPFLFKACSQPCYIKIYKDTAIN
ncbi:MAG: hypothetical protein EXX96DRAFT_25343 [Benjaminiella poitrasii]|nr:MAG: hypothetical protein EXX96DRAFT_25343 [Benjaminiella poitrasii]